MSVIKSKELKNKVSDSLEMLNQLLLLLFLMHCAEMFYLHHEHMLVCVCMYMCVHVAIAQTYPPRVPGHTGKWWVNSEG